MVRYKRYRKYGRRRSTNTIKMKFQSFMDISTSDDSMQIITISAGGPNILKRLSAQFAAYKYFKIGNVSCKLVPASTLPVDPTGLSYEAGENTVDPRDQLTPGLMRITNGEDIFEDMTGISDAIQHGIYNNMLLDPRWFKWMLQSGVKRHATPRYWQIGQLHQDKWPGAITNLPLLDKTEFTVDGTVHESKNVVEEGVTVNSFFRLGSDPRGLFQTGHRGVLGWLPTDDYQPIPRTVAQGGDTSSPFIAAPPEVEVMKIILPKAYKTKYFYRMFITETVYFREPIVNFGITDANGIAYRPLDVFHLPSVPIPMAPPAPATVTFPVDEVTGGNYGDD